MQGQKFISYPLMRILALLILFASFVEFPSACAQPSDPDTLNRTDPKGRKQGSWMKKDQEGHLVYEGRFKDDQPVGEFRYYYPDGKLRSSLRYEQDGRKVLNTSFHPNGVKMAEGWYVDKQKDGTWKYYNDIGDCASEESYKNGTPVGTWKVFYTEQRIMEEFSYVNGKKEGPWKQYFPTGNLRSESKYLNGELDGPARFYFPDGSIMTRGMYRNGLKDGLWENFRQDGQKQSIHEYLNGELVSETYYDKAREKELHGDNPAREPGQ